MSTLKPAACSVLAAILNENGDSARAIRGRFHPTMISRWKHAARLPDLQSAIELSKLTEGRLAPELWELPPAFAATGTDGEL